MPSPEEAILVILATSNRPIPGRTAIQKMVYFLSIKADVDFGYGPHFYGPYSPVVAKHLENLVSSGYVAEEGTWTTQDRKMYSYTLTGDGRYLADRIHRGDTKFYSTARYIVNRCQKIAQNNLYILSWAAKVYYLLTRKKSMISDQEAIEAGSRFGWKLSRSDIASAMKLLTGLQLARRANR